MKRKKILENKIYLYITEFFAGMSLMAVELGASRLLAPYFSSSQIVWTIIIGTIMIAMALGNIYGGKAVDKNPDPDLLYKRIVIAAIWIGLIPLLGKYIILGISALIIFSVNTNFLIWAAFASCMIVFVFPLFLLGTVTPSLAKYTMDNLEENGKTVGMLNASNTIGSIIGTFLPTFVTIPAIGTSLTFITFASILIIICMIYFFSNHTVSIRCIVAVILLGISAIFSTKSGFAFWEKGLVYEGESVYNYLQVKENDKEVILSTNVLFGVQSVYEKSDSLTGMYYDYAMAAPLMSDLYAKEEMNILVLGMGTGTFATQSKKYFTDGAKLHIEGVEIDEKITDLARKYFHLSPDIPVHTYDGRSFLNVSDKAYDVIMVDAYQDITIPFSMSSVEFFGLVKEHLKDDGVMVVNMNMKGSKKGNINEYISDTINSVFSEVYTIDVPYSTNRELFASNNPDMMRIFSENIKEEPNRDLSSLMESVNTNLLAYSPGEFILTDDKAPVELLGMRIIDDIIEDELNFYKEIYNELGLQGFIKYLIG